MGKSQQWRRAPGYEQRDYQGLAAQITRRQTGCIPGSDDGDDRSHGDGGQQGCRVPDNLHRQTIPAGTSWYQYDSPDLLQAIPDAARITKVTIGGSGWDFGSRIGMVSLKGS